MKNIIFLLVFASLVFGVNLEPTKPRTLQDIEKDAREDIKTVESGSDDCKVLRGILLYINEKYENFATLCDNDKTFTIEEGDFVYVVSKAHEIGRTVMINGGFIIKLEKFNSIDENLTEDFNLSEKFKEKYLMQGGVYVGEEISAEKALDIINYLSDNSDLILPIYGKGDYWYVRENFNYIQNIYNNKFYISDKECLNLVNEEYKYSLPNSGYGDILFNHLKFVNGADFDTKECKAVFDNDEFRKLQKEINEKRNRFSVLDFGNQFVGRNLYFIDHMNKVYCDMNMWWLDSENKYESNEALLKLFNNEDKDNLFRKNYKTAIFERFEEDYYSGRKLDVIIRKGKYNTGVMVGKEELIVNVTENGVEKLLEKPDKKGKYAKMRCELIEK